MKENVDRDYQQMYECYEKVKQKYEGKEQNAEMGMLDTMIQEFCYVLRWCIKKCVGEENK